MSRGLLSDERLEEIAAKLPDLNSIKRVLLLDPDVISMKLGPKSRVPEAIVCLHDALRVADEVRYALHEMLAHLIWYRQDRGEPIEEAAIYFGRFYADDAALRLYAAAEHVANFIVGFLDLDQVDLKRYAKGRPSLHSVVGHYLMAERPDEPITKAVHHLVQDSNWTKTTIEYRNPWVHEQPPIIAGLGIAWKRGPRWVVTERGHMLSIKFGDTPSFTVDELTKMVLSANEAFIEMMSRMVDILVEFLAKQGFDLDFTKGEISVRMF